MENILSTIRKVLENLKEDLINVKSVDDLFRLRINDLRFQFLIKLLTDVKCLTSERKCYEIEGLLVCVSEKLIYVDDLLGLKVLLRCRSYFSGNSSVMKCYEISIKNIFGDFTFCIG